MCHLSPPVHLAWCILAWGLQIFLIQHLWRYDRFKCLAWSSGRQPGAFKRIMTYSYLASVPALVVFTSAMTVFKYRNGYRFIPGHGIVPTPYQLWSASDRALLTPLHIVFGVAWGLELVTHLEELFFWLFLIHQGPKRRDWFSSIEFRAWAIGSLLAMAGMPATAIFTRDNPLKTEGYIFLVGGSASTALTAIFLIVLFKFPEFLRRVKREGAAGPVILRLVKFHELNILRVIFRVFMTIPLLVLGIDGIQGHHVINSTALWTDLFALLAAVGMIVSSTLTLLIFFPRSLAEDSNWRPETTMSHISYNSATMEYGRPRNFLTAKVTHRDSSYSESGIPIAHDQEEGSTKAPPLLVSKTRNKYYSSHFTSPSALTTAYYPPTLLGDSGTHLNVVGDDEMKQMEEGDLEEDGQNGAGSEVPPANEMTGDGKAKQPKPDADDQKDPKRSTRDSALMKVRMKQLGEAVDAGLKKPPRPPRLHPYITSFTSPIDLMQLHDKDGPRAI